MGRTRGGPQALVIASGLLPDTKRHYLVDFERDNQRPFLIKSGERPAVDTLAAITRGGSVTAAIPAWGEDAF